MIPPELDPNDKVEVELSNGKHIVKRAKDINWTKDSVLTVGAWRLKTNDDDVVPMGPTIIDAPGEYLCEDGGICFFGTRPSLDGVWPGSRDGQTVFYYADGRPTQPSAAPGDRIVSKIVWESSKNKSADNVLEGQIAGNHYRKHGEYQPWEVLRRWLTPDEFRGFMKGQAIVYLARERDKNGLEDIEKAEHYLRAMIEFEKAGPV